MLKAAEKREVTEVPNEGLVSFLNKNILVFCLNYIYAGVLEGVNETCLKLKDAKIVYETGGFASKSYTTAETLPGPWYIQLSAIESFGLGK